MSIRKILKLLISMLIIAMAYPAKQELKIDILTPASPTCQRRTKKSDILNVHYVGKLVNGKQFESSYANDKPHLFMLGTGQVLKGWEQGLMDMCKGEKRRLTIPPHLGYGSKQAGEVPPDSTVIYDIELMDVRDNDDINNAFPTMDLNHDGFLDMKEVKQIFASYDSVMKKYLPFDLDESTKFFMIQTMFQTVDRNRDGVLSAEEFKKLTSLGSSAMGMMGMFGGKKTEL